MKLTDITENVVQFETPDAKQKRMKKEDQLKKLKSIDNIKNQKRLDVLAKRSQIKSVK